MGMPSAVLPISSFATSFVIGWKGVAVEALHRALAEDAWRPNDRHRLLDDADGAVGRLRLHHHDARQVLTRAQSARHPLACRVVDQCARRRQFDLHVRDVELHAGKVAPMGRSNSTGLRVFAHSTA